jgi:Phytanoyl-CoA dioxygenase (PhyH)
MRLSHQQALHFRQVGYLRVPDVLEPEFVTQISDFLTREFAAADGDGAVRSGGQVKLYDFLRRAGDLGTRLVRHPRLVGVLSGLLGPNIVLTLNRHNQASMNAPGEAEPRLHRDVLQWTRNVVTAVVYLQDSNEANGCTYLIPGSQYAPFVGVPQQDGGGTWMDQHEEFAGLLDQAVPVPVARGGVLLMDSLVFHSVGPNRSATERRSIVLGYRSADELDPRELDPRQYLVAGEDLYRGNDRALAGAH